MDVADFFVALSENEQTNILSSLLAKRLGAKKAIVLTVDPAFVPIINSLGMEIVINPRLVTVGSILQHIRRGHPLSVAKFHNSEAEVLELVADETSKIVGRPLKEISFPQGSILGAIVREGVMQIPTGNTMINPGSTSSSLPCPMPSKKYSPFLSPQKG